MEILTYYNICRAIKIMQEPPFPPPIGNVVRLFLKICSKAKNFKILRFTEEYLLLNPIDLIGLLTSILID